MLVKPKQQQKPRKHQKQREINGLPNTFVFAAEALKIMSKCGGSAGSVIVKKYKNWNYKLIYALAMNTLKNMMQIKQIIETMKLQSRFKTIDSFMLEILVGDLLFGKGLKTVEQNDVAAGILALKENILKHQAKSGNDARLKNKSDEQASDPKYLRVNHLKSTLDHVLVQLKNLGLKKLEYSKDKIKFKKFIAKFKAMADDEFMLDFHFPDDLILLKNASIKKLKKSDLISKGKAVLQDKASFMAVAAMNLLPEKLNILDACCAPGGKTTAIASMIRNKGKIVGYDCNKERLALATHLCKKQGATCAQLECLDFSKVKLNRVLKRLNTEKLDMILLDPSCSGSGIKNRFDYYETKEQTGRLKKLQAFQVSLLKHAIDSEATKSIIYCTCSTSTEENEEVIEMALKESKLGDYWEISPVLPYWTTRGRDGFEFSEKCLRSDETCLTNGFFIARLDRKPNQIVPDT